MVDTTEQTELMSREEIEYIRSAVVKVFGPQGAEIIEMLCDMCLRAHDIKDEALEEAAQAVEDHIGGQRFSDWHRSIPKRIRSLKGKP